MKAAAKAEAFKVAVLGHLCLDIVAEAPTLSTGAEQSYWVPLVECPGGSAYHFAHAARGRSIETMIISCVGDDLAGRSLEQQLLAEALPHHVHRVPNEPTARVFIAYGSNGARLMFAPEKSASGYLSRRFVESVWPTLPGFDAVWLSGLCLRDRKSATFAAVLDFVGRARLSGARIALDVVPHEFHRHFRTLAGVVTTIGPIDLIVSELASARRLVGLGNPGETLTEAMLSATAAQVVKHIPSVVLRQRFGSRYMQVTVVRGARPVLTRRPMPRGSALRGFGDVLSCEVIVDLLRSTAVRAATNA